ncbi:Uncharacterised protein [Achromobacter xylosoxidans]|nr:Uncharacterised protein [Achromobacter xylosoxidans]
MPFWSTVKVPYWPLPSLLTDQVCVSLVSTSVLVSWPVVTSVPSSLTVPVAVPPMVGASLVPVMSMVMTCVALPPLPSSTVTVMESVAFWPSARAWTLALLLSST